jgi:hypothetical protein
MLNGVFLIILETKICVYALPNCWWFMCMHSIYKTYFIFILGGGIWMVVKGPKRNSILLYVAKIWEESANKFKWAYKGGLRMHAKRGTLWMPFVCILPIECPLFRPFYALCLLKLTMQKKSLWKWRNEKEKRKKKPSINSLRNITQNIIKSQILYGIKSSPFWASLYLIC